MVTGQDKIRENSIRTAGRSGQGKALSKDFYREIRLNLARFLSLFLIVALGVAFYTGIRATAPVMRNTADTYLDTHKLMDLRVISTLGLRETDVSRLAEISGIEAAMGSYTSDIYLQQEDSSLVLRVHNLPSEKDGHLLNEPILRSGRWPEAENEVAVEETLLEDGLYELGDTIRLTLPDDAIYVQESAVIVGAVRSPYYISLEREPTELGTGMLSYYLYAPDSAFDSDFYSEVFLTVDGARELDTYSESYETLIEDRRAEVEEVLPSLVRDRYEEIRSEAEAEIEDARKTLAEEREKADADLASARQELDSGWAALEKSQSDLDAGEEGLAELETAYEQLLAIGHEAEAQALLPQIEAARSELEAGKSEIAKAQADLTAGEADYAEGKAEAEEEFAAAEQEIAEAEADLTDIPEGEGFILDRKTNIGVETYGQNAERIEAVAQVFPAIFFLVATLISLTSMSRMVEEERSQIGTLKALGYSSAQTFRKYFVFALLASVLGGLAGGLFGIQFFPSFITNAYGILYQLPPPLITIYPDMMIWGILFASLSTVAGVIIAAVPDMRRTPAALMRPPAPKPGKRIWLESITPVWKRLSFSYKVSLRNMFRFKKRLFMTLFGIGGCTALLLTGFGLQDSINAVVGDQFSQVFLYDANIHLTKEPAEDKQAELDERLLAIPGETSRANTYSQDVTVLKEGADLNRPLEELTFTSGVSAIVSESAGNFADIIHFVSPDGKEEYQLDDQGILITAKLADRLKVSAGDRITIQKYTGVSGSAVGSDEEKTVIAEPFAVTVSGVVQNYLGHYVFMTSVLLESMEAANPEELFWNSIYLSNPELENQSTADSLASDLLELDSVSQVSYARDLAETFAKSMERLDLVIVIIILAAGALDVLVLYNLNNINISERKREIATLKVLGFNRRELANYIYRENVFLMVLGILLGLAGGVLLHRYLILTVEVDITRFGRIIEPMSWVYSIVMTVVFTLGVNLAMYPKIQQTDMVESLKSIE